MVDIIIAKGIANLLAVVFLATTLSLFVQTLDYVDEVQCDNGAPIPSDRVNDGIIDCADGSDESPAAEDWPETTNPATWFGLSLILLVIFGFLSLKLGKEVKKFGNDLRMLKAERRKDAEAQRKSAEAQRKSAEEEKLRKKRAQRRQGMREKASERERALDYDSAIEIWEELGEIEEAARVRKLKARQGSVRVAQKVVHGDEITKTEIKDSVVSKSSVGGNSKAEGLREAKSLFEEGLIDESEYKQMKKEILGK